MKITVLGSGAWGTALALLLLENGNDVTLWSYTEEESRVLRETRENPMLKGVELPEALKFTTDMSAVKGCGLVVYMHRGNIKRLLNGTESKFSLRKKK